MKASNRKRHLLHDLILHMVAAYVYPVKISPTSVYFADDMDDGFLPVLEDLAPEGYAVIYHGGECIEIAPDKEQSQICAHPGCQNHTDDGEGYNGYCGTCADLGRDKAD